MDTYKLNIRILGAQRLRRISSHDVCYVVCVVAIFGLRLIWNKFRAEGHGPKAKKKHNMISRSDFHYGFGDLKHGQYGKMGCFWAKWKLQNDVEGIHAPKYFMFEIQLFRYLGDPFSKKKNFGDPPCALQHYSTEKRPLKKWTPTSKIFTFWGLSASGAFQVAPCMCALCCHAFCS